MSEFSFFKQKHVFVVHEDEEIETLIHESQHSDENSDRHEVEMLTPNKNNICQSTCMNAFFYYLFNLLLTVYRNMSVYLSSKLCTELDFEK